MPVTPQSTSQYYPTLLTVMNLVRGIMNDSFAGATDTPGEGQIVTDNNTISPFVLPVLNSSIREVYRKLRNVSGAALINDNYIVSSLSVIDGPQGNGIPDAAIQVRLGFDGYDNGSGVVNTSQTLPQDLIMPLRMWERVSNTNDVFLPMNEANDGLLPRLQVQNLCDWEWRNGNIYMNGSTNVCDVRIRYLQHMPEFFNTDMDFSTTQIPIFDCEEAVAYGVVKRLCPTFGAAGPTVMQITESYNEAIHDLRNEEVRRMQRQNFKRQTYSDEYQNSDYPYVM